MDQLLNIYQGLKEPLEEKFWNRFSDQNIYGCHVTAAFSKCFEFNLVINSASLLDESFYYTPVLRGIAEDLIVLKFIKKHKKLDANAVLKNYMMMQLIEICEKQTKFFDENHPQQIVFKYPDAEYQLKGFVEGLKTEWAKIGLNKEKTFPSTSHMAVDAGLIEVYDYLYAATSDMVHFSPHILMRSGWSKKDDKMFHRFSMQNFNKYYKLFNQFYGSYLFTIFVKTFKKQLTLNKTILKEIYNIEQIISDEARWPELVTFEEMNVPEAERIRMINVIRNLGSKIKLRQS